jgi:hypothetical protein
MKELIKLEKKYGTHKESSTEFYCNQTKKRYDFLMEHRKINPVEYQDRINNEWIKFIERE